VHKIYIFIDKRGFIAFLIFVKFVPKNSGRPWYTGILLDYFGQALIYFFSRGFVYKRAKQHVFQKQFDHVN
jgi:hypothetical protein